MPTVFDQPMDVSVDLPVFYDLSFNKFKFFDKAPAGIVSVILLV